MSSRNDRFECRWRPSRRLLAGYCVAQLLALCSIFTLQLPPLLALVLLLGSLAHGTWALPRQVLLTSASAVTGLQRTREGWAVFTKAAGWQPVQLRRDSLALPLIIILRYRVPGQWWSRSVCIPADALPGETHRRLRLRLRWSRDRFEMPGMR